MSLRAPRVPDDPHPAAVRILVATEHFPSPFKGYIDAQAAEFIRLGAEVSFLALGHWGHGISRRLAAWDPDPEIRYVPRDAGRPVEMARSLIPAARFPVRTLRLAARIVSAWGVGRGSARALVRGIRMGRPDADVALVHDLATLVALRALGLVRPDLPLVLWYHGGEIPGTRILPPDEVLPVLDRIEFALTNTEFSARHLIARGMPAERVHIHRLGIHPDDYPLVEDRRFMPDGVLRLLFLGRLSAEKGLMDVFEALTRIPAERRVHLRLAGEGILDHELHAAATRMGLGDRVTFLDRLDLAGVNRELARSDALLLASRPVRGCAENQAMVIQEAMFTGLPVLSTWTGGIPEVVPPGLRELLVPPDDPEALTARIAAFADLPEARWRALSREAYEYAHRHFSIDRVTPPVFERLAAVAAAGRRSRAAAG